MTSMFLIVSLFSILIFRFMNRTAVLRSIASNDQIYLDFRLLGEYSTHVRNIRLTTNGEVVLELNALTSSSISRFSLKCGNNNLPIKGWVQILVSPTRKECLVAPIANTG